MIDTDVEEDCCEDDNYEEDNIWNDDNSEETVDIDYTIYI